MLNIGFLEMYDCKIRKFLIVKFLSNGGAENQFRVGVIQIVNHEKTQDFNAHIFTHGIGVHEL